MSAGPVRIRRDGSTTVFELDHPDELTIGLLESLDWPEDAPKTAFRFREPVIESALSTLSTLPSRYIVRIGYTAQTSAFAATAGSPFTSGGEWQTPTDLEALKLLTRKTIIERFYEPWRELETPAFVKDVEAFLEHGLAMSASANYLIDGRTAGLINLMTHHDCHALPVDHIAWVWIDENLTPVERADAHVRLLAWLASKPTGRIHAFVHTFNVRSRRFFGKIGFSPACIHISKRP